jgi:hypothetical protein
LEDAEAQVRTGFSVVRASELLVVVWMVAMWLRQIAAGCWRHVAEVVCCGPQVVNRPMLILSGFGLLVWLQL